MGPFIEADHSVCVVICADLCGCACSLCVQRSEDPANYEECLSLLARSHSIAWGLSDHVMARVDVGNLLESSRSYHPVCGVPEMKSGITRACGGATRTSN